MRGEATIIMRGINHYYINNRGANFPHLQQMAELRRNQRAEIGRRHVMAHYAAASVRFCCHLAHPDQRQNMSDTPWNQEPRPLLLTKNVTGSCTSPSYWCVRMKETRPGCPRSNPNTSPYSFQASLRRGKNGEESLFERGEGYTEISRRLVYQFSKNDSNWRGEASKKGEGMGERDRERERERKKPHGGVFEWVCWTTMKFYCLFSLFKDFQTDRIRLICTYVKNVFVGIIQICDNDNLQQGLNIQFPQNPAHEFLQ